jgi:hypothetical protein
VTILPRKKREYSPRRAISLLTRVAVDIPALEPLDCQDGVGAGDDGPGVPDGEAWAEGVVDDKMDAAVVAKILLSALKLQVSLPAHLSQKGTASSRSLPIPPRFFLRTTGSGRVAWPALSATA